MTGPYWKVVAIGIKLSQKNKDLIHRMLKSVLGIDEEEIGIFDLDGGAIFQKQHWPRLVIGFGAKALAQYLDRHPKDYIIGLATHPDALEPGQDEEARQVAYHHLLRAKEYVANLKLSADQYQTITEDSLPNLTANDVVQLEKTLRQLGKDRWKGVTKSGKSFLLTVETTTEGNEDIKMTFAELFALRAAMETLQITEFQIVHPKTSSRTDS